MMTLFACELCAAADVQRLHSAWWSSVAGRFEDIEFDVPVNQYVLASKAPDDSEQAYTLGRWRHFPILQEISRRSSRGGRIIHIAVHASSGLPPARVRLQRANAQKLGIAMTEYHGASRDHVVMIHDLTQLTVADLGNQNLPHFMHISDFVLIEVNDGANDSFDPAMLPLVWKLRHFPQERVQELNFLVKEAFLWTVANNGVLVHFVRDVRDIEWPVFYAGAKSDRALRSALASFPCDSMDSTPYFLGM